MTGSSFFSVEKIADSRSGGTTQAETRIYNERLIVSLVRRHGQLSKTDLTRMTGLSAQTITTIVNRAAGHELLLRREPLRGRLGQPSVPYSLNPEAAYSFGLKVDHRSADVALVNFIGEVVAFERTLFDYPTPNDIMKFAKRAITGMCRKHKSIAPDRIAGLGIASPFHRWNLGEDRGVSSDKLSAWNEIDIRAELDRFFDWPVFLHNDATVSAAAELMFGAGGEHADFLYVYIGESIDGGLVLDHHLFPGRNKLAGLLGDIPFPAPSREGNGQTRLLRTASLHSLAGKLDDKDSERIWLSPENWGELGAPLDDWIDEVSVGLTYATRGAVALLDIDSVVIDGAMPNAVRREIAKAARRKLSRILVDRPEPFSVLEGSFGHTAPVIGGASIPLLVKYSNDKDLLFKE